jgi:hypothetical protein
MLNISTAFEIELKKFIAQEIERISENLLVGLSIQNMEQYKHETGRVAALRLVLDMCEEVNTIISQR